MKKHEFIMPLLLFTVVTLGMTAMSEKGKMSVTANMNGVSENIAVEAPKIALTFDDGPNPLYTEKLLDGLKKRNVKVTFFMLGENIEKNPEIVKRVAKEGHLIGNHSYKHEELSKMPVEQVCAQLSKTYNMIYELTGNETCFVRPPYGAWKKSYDCDINMIPVLWTVDTLDWTTSDVNAIVNKVVNKERENDIILMHDAYESSVQASFQIIDYLLDKGYDLVTVDKIILD